ncbi:hypothetical protein [Chryseobacterium aurantiacum]|uniref:hypothetical protein n=1 Tax=Chryseobacterium aurantiacum TaxID=2116499 RepID=UPI0013C4A7DF|nr:hypothetical protein [Chryseobacterium aurantiacum]
MMLLAPALSTNPHPLTYLRFNGDSGRMVHFSLFRMVEALVEKVFFGAGFGMGRFGGVGSGVAMHEA